MNLQCANCEGILLAGDGFCTLCGSPRQQAGATSGLPEILAILPRVMYYKGFLGFGSTQNIMLITREHVLIAETPKTMLGQIDALEDELQVSYKQGSRDEHEFIKAQDFSQAPWQIYAYRPVGDVLKESPHNRLLELGRVKKVEACMHEGWMDDYLYLYLARETLKFRFLWPLGEIAMEALQIVLGDKVKKKS